MQSALLALVPMAQYQCCRPLQPNWAVHCSTPGMQSAEDQALAAGAAVAAAIAAVILVIRRKARATNPPAAQLI